MTTRTRCTASGCQPQIAAPFTLDDPNYAMCHECGRGLRVARDGSLPKHDRPQK